MAESIKYVNAWAESYFTSRTVWVSAISIIIGFTALPTTLALVPLKWLPVYLMIDGALGLILRKLTTRPVEFIAPGTSMPIQIPKIGPPDPPLITG